MLPIPAEPANEANPVCGTVACVAGWAVILGETDYQILQTSFAGLYTHKRAMELLNLSDWEADYLFSAARSRTEVLDYLDALIGDPGTG